MRLTLQEDTCSSNRASKEMHLARMVPAGAEMEVSGEAANVLELLVPLADAVDKNHPKTASVLVVEVVLAQE